METKSEKEVSKGKKEKNSEDFEQNVGHNRE
jgi:hypothetical protein